ncbi:MAG: hypothetical protein NTV94_07400, partial [Planctomycetota bacterium]|nr:hypothetical protein [Planctomycetota bacterium]
LLVMHRRELLAHSYDLDLHLHLLMLINPVCMVLAGPLLARRLMIAKTLLVGILALLAFSAPVGYS